MLDANVSAVRHFSRYYTRRIGVLEDSLLGSGLSLPQGRVLFEIAEAGGGEATPGYLCQALGLDGGYMSRLISQLEGLELVVRRPSTRDGRSISLALTPRGQLAKAQIDLASRSEISKLLLRLPASRQRRIVEAMRVIETELETEVGASSPTARLRDPRCGDMGWVVHRHGALYHQEYGWDQSFEALVAKIAGEFILQFDPQRDCCRIAELHGQIVGSSFVVRTEIADVAKLRLVYVEPSMRGTGLGRRLVEDCMAFSRRAGYRRMTLWTNDPLVAARHLYQRLGFELIASEPVTAFGQAMMSETWERDL